MRARSAQETRSFYIPCSVSERTLIAETNHQEKTCLLLEALPTSSGSCGEPGLPYSLKRKEPYCQYIPHVSGGCVSWS